MQKVCQNSERKRTVQPAAEARNSKMEVAINGYIIPVGEKHVYLLFAHSCRLLYLPLGSGLTTTRTLEALDVDFRQVKPPPPPLWMRVFPIKDQGQLFKSCRPIALNDDKDNNVHKLEEERADNNVKDLWLSYFLNKYLQ